jgi:hypothetical protein
MFWEFSALFEKFSNFGVLIGVKLLPDRCATRLFERWWGCLKNNVQEYRVKRRARSVDFIKLLCKRCARNACYVIKKVDLTLSKRWVLVL